MQPDAYRIGCDPNEERRRARKVRRRHGDLVCPLAYDRRLRRLYEQRKRRERRQRQREAACRKGCRCA